MKIIDLLNKIANGNIPERIRFENEIYIFKKDSYYTFFDNKRIHLCIATSLNDTVEILEEEKKIPEKLNTWYGIEPVNLDSPTTFKDNSKYIDFNTEMFFDKINEIIDYLDYLKNKGE